MSFFLFINRGKYKAAVSVIEETIKEEYTRMLNSELIECKAMPKAGEKWSAMVGYAYQRTFDYLIDLEWNTHKEEHSDAAELVISGMAGYLSVKWDCKSPHYE